MAHDPRDMQQSQDEIKTTQKECQETQGTRIDMSLSTTQGCSKEQKAWKPTSHEQGGWYLKEPRMKNHEGK